MIEQDSLTPLEAYLASLKPRSPKLDRDGLMFLAGQASVTYCPTYRTSSFRPVMLSALVAAAVTLAVVTATQSGARIVGSMAAAAQSEPSQERSAPRPTATVAAATGADSLGPVVVWLIGSPPAETSATDSDPNLLRQLKQMLQEEAGVRGPKVEGRSPKAEGQSKRTEAPNSRLQSLIPNP